VDLRAGGRHDVEGYFVLQREHVRHFAIELVAPEMVSRIGLDELGCDTNTAAGLSNAPLQHIVRAQLAADFGHIDGFALEQKRRTSCEYGHSRLSRKSGDDLVGEAVGEIVNVLVATQIVEWQDRNRGNTSCGWGSGQMEFSRASFLSLTQPAPNAYGL
jgi:hypothetical protein